MSSTDDRPQTLRLDRSEQSLTPRRTPQMNVQPSQTVKGKDRYKAGVMEYRKMGY